MFPVDSVLDYITGVLELKNIIILTGETGSGKTLRIPQIAYFLSLSSKRKILCTQPRRIAVCCAAKEISKRLCCKLGTLVGYSVRFEECNSFETKIKFITEGLFLKEWLHNPCLKGYSTLIIDEAHERSSNIDILLYLIRTQINLRLNVKIILMSATINSEKFSRFLFDCPVLSVPGRCFSIKCFFLKLTSEKFIFNATRTILKILCTTSSGNILVFLKGKKDIDKLGHILFSLKNFLSLDSEYEIYPIFSEISTKEQISILDILSINRKIILATNIAEASVTISNVNFVIDTGLSKFNYFDLRWNQQKLTTFPINTLSSNQRSGRTGRTKSGKCFRLYTKWSMKNELGKFFLPEIQRIDCCTILLLFKSLGIKKFISLNWLDNPPKILIIIGLKTLYLLGAISKKNRLTVLGRKLVELPLKPMLGKSLILSIKFNCKKEILYLSCMLSISFSRFDVEILEDSIRGGEFFKSDQMIFSRIFQKWKESGYSYRWCQKKNLNFTELSLGKNIEVQLVLILEKFQNLKICSKKKEVEKALISGFFLNIAKLEKHGFYKPLFSRYSNFLKIHPGSFLKNFPLIPNLILFDHLFFNIKIFMKIITVIKIEHLNQFSSSLFNDFKLFN